MLTIPPTIQSIPHVPQQVSIAKVAHPQTAQTAQAAQTAEAHSRFAALGATLLLVGANGAGAYH